MIFDTHAHYDDDAFISDRNIILKNLICNNISKVVNVGANISSSKEAYLLSKQYDYVYSALGVHPSETNDLNEELINELRDMLNDEKVVAIGEIGLDYHYDEPSLDIQKKWFVRQLHLAREYNLPVIIHSRDAAQDTFQIMKDERAEEIGGVIHCYSYSAEMALEYVKMGFYIGVGGVVTFKNARKLVETVDVIPMESIVLETDCPYLAPVPFRGERNSSLYLSYVVKKIAEIKSISEKEVEDITYRNALNLYKIKE